MPRFVPRTKDARLKLAGRVQPVTVERTLECGHRTYEQPVVTGADRGGWLYRCPDGCGLQKKGRRS